MNLTNALQEYIYLVPMVMLAVAGLLVLLIGVMADRFPKGRLNHWMPPEYLSIALIVPSAFMAGIALWQAIRTGGQAFFEVPRLSDIKHAAYLLHVDAFGAFFGLLAIVGTFVVIIMSTEYFGDHNTKHRAEYFSLLFFATSAITLVAVSTDLLMIYLSMEFLSLSSYVLASYWKKEEKSSEAGLKYLLFGAASSAIMLYGMSMLYGLAGSTNLAQIASSILNGQIISHTGALAAVIMVLAGLGFKLALVPFHLWAPDTYEGAPTPITAWLSVASKAAGLAVMTRFLLVAIPLRTGFDWYSLMIVLAAASMTLGNLVAITQKNVKRMLAYSSIAQVGYMLVGVLAVAATINTHAPGYAVRVGYTAVSGENLGTANWGLGGLLIYAMSYLVMNLGAFAVVIAIERSMGNTEISSFTGLIRRAPFLAAAFVVFMLSLAGIPPTAGFLGKFYIFAGAIQTNQTPLLILAIIAVANSVVSVYYYFNVVRLMFMRDTETKAPVTASKPLIATVAAMLILTIGILCAASPIIRLIQKVVL